MTRSGPCLERVLFCLALVTTLLVGYAVLGTGTGKARAAGRTERAYAYGGHERQRLTAYWQPIRTQRPGIVLLHDGYPHADGGWTSRARGLADQGYAVFDVGHRLPVDAPWSAQRDDVLRALSWVDRKAGDFGLARGRVVVLGSSAGGRLAIAVATYGSGSNRVRGAVALSPADTAYPSYGPGDAPLYLLDHHGSPVTTGGGITAETVPGGAHGGALLDVPGVATRVLRWIAVTV